MHMTLILTKYRDESIEELMDPYYEGSDDNIESKWDWYEVGGRWPGRLTLKEGAKTEPQVSFSWGWSEDEKREFLKQHPRASDFALKKEIENWDSLTSYAILHDGEWIEEEGYDEPLKVSEVLKDIPDDMEIVCIDYHD